MKNRSKSRSLKWRGEIKRSGTEIFTPTSELGSTEPLHRLARTSKEMERNILFLEQLRKCLYPDYDRVIQRQVVTIKRPR